MVRLKRKRSTKKYSDEVVKETYSKIDKPFLSSKVISTGSTLLDLAISGGRIRGGGVPGGIIMEVFGPSGSGKTAILSELCASSQANGGEVCFLDPEARLDRQYCNIYGLSLPDKAYYRPDTVTEMFTFIEEWSPSSSDTINVIAADSLAALSTETEMEDRDKMGMRRAKEFSEGLRKTCRLIANKEWLIACSNQVREGVMGEVTPGGKGIPFYSSLRIRVRQRSKIPRTVSLKGKSKRIEKSIGIYSICEVKKSTVDNPFREAPIYIVFGYGIDDVRGNLQWYKDMTGSKVYDCFDKEHHSMDKAISFIEENNYQGELRERVIDLWEEIEQKFIIKRKSKRGV